MLSNLSYSSPYLGSAWPSPNSLLSFDLYEARTPSNLDFSYIVHLCRAGDAKGRVWVS